MKLLSRHTGYVVRPNQPTRDSCFFFLLSFFCSTSRRLLITHSSLFCPVRWVYAHGDRGRRRQYGRPKEFLCSIDGLGMGMALCVRNERTGSLIFIIFIIIIIMRNTYRAVRLFVKFVSVVASGRRFERGCFGRLLPAKPTSRRNESFSSRLTGTRSKVETERRQRDPWRLALASHSPILSQMNDHAVSPAAAAAATTLSKGSNTLLLVCVCMRTANETTMVLRGHRQRPSDPRKKRWRFVGSTPLPRREPAPLLQHAGPKWRARPTDWTS
jgi:hypothetical protein